MVSYLWLSYLLWKSDIKNKCRSPIIAKERSYKVIPGCCHTGNNKIASCPTKFLLTDVGYAAVLC